MLLFIFHYFYFFTFSKQIFTGIFRILKKFGSNKELINTKELSRNIIEITDPSGDNIEVKDKIQAITTNNKEASNLQKYRFLVLFLSVMINFGYYYCYDLPNVLSDLIFDELTHEKDTSVLYNQLYSIISLPNVFLPFLGSIMIFKIGINSSIFILNLLIIVGQSIFMVSGFMANEDSNDYSPFYTALIGRFIFGLGGEILNVWQILVLCRYFKNKELSFSIGMYYSCTWFAVSMWNYITPYISNLTSLGVALLTCTLVSLISVLAAVVLIYVDNHAWKINDYSAEINEEMRDFNWSDLKELTIPFWTIAFNSLFIFAGMLFYNISNEYFTSRYGFNQIEAAKFGANSNLLFILITPLFGFIVDKIGHRVTMIFYSSFALAFSELIFIMIPPSTSDNLSYLGYIPIMLIGIASAVYYAGMYPTIPLTVKPHFQGTAFGINASLSNLGVSLSPLLVGAWTFKSLKENTYFWVNISLGISSLIGSLLAIYLYIYDRLYLDGILQKPAISLEQEEMKQFIKENEIDSAL